MLKAPLTVANANARLMNFFDVKRIFIESENYVCSTIALKLNFMSIIYLGKSTGLSAKKNRFSKHATTAKQNSNNSSIQNWSLIDSKALADPSVSV